MESFIFMVDFEKCAEKIVFHCLSFIIILVKPTWSVGIYIISITVKFEKLSEKGPDNIPKKHEQPK